MTNHREKRGSCLIEARAEDLGQGRHWKPWLRLTSSAGGACASQTYDRLKPVFGSEQAALAYAAELGRSLADEGSTLGRASRNPEIAKWPLNLMFSWLRTYRSNALTFPF